MSSECGAPRQNQNNRQQNLNKLAKLQPIPQRKIFSATKYFKLHQSTTHGQHIDNANEGPPFQLLKFVVDHRSLYLQVSILNKQIEAVCDSGASVSCLSIKLFNQINEIHEVKIQPSTTRLSTANQMPTQIKGSVSVRNQIGPKKYEHTFYALIEAASNCRLGLDFLEAKKCGELFSEGKLKFDRNTLVPIHRKQFSFNEQQA